MFQILNRFPNIKICLEPGLYQFNGESATGKTWLTNTLRQFSTYGEAVNGYSLIDFKRGISLQEVLADTNTKVVVIDRYDMLPAELSECIDAATNKVVILDCKHGYCGKRGIFFCNLHIEESLITVTL